MLSLTKTILTFILEQESLNTSVDTCIIMLDIRMLLRKFQNLFWNLNLLMKYSWLPIFSKFKNRKIDCIEWKLSIAVNSHNDNNGAFGISQNLVYVEQSRIHPRPFFHPCICVSNISHKVLNFMSAWTIIPITILNTSLFPVKMYRTTFRNSFSVCLSDALD